MRYPVPPMFATVAIAFAAYVVMGFRLVYMARPPLSFRSSFCGVLVGLAVNNVLPAKAGEISKALWLGRSNGISFQKALGIVFMERFFDVNVLALLSLWFLWFNDGRGTFTILVASLLLGWTLLAIFYHYPSLTGRFVRLFGRGRLRDFVEQALSAVLSNMSRGRLIWLAATSLTGWFFYGLQMHLSVNAVAGLNLPWDAVLSVFAFSGLSMLLPSSPGAFGVYEAFMVTALKRYGVDAEEALAVALFAHMTQFIPVTLAGGLLFAAFPEKAKVEKKE